MTTEGLSGLMDAALNGDAAASAQLESHYRAVYPEPQESGPPGGPGFAAPLGSPGFGLTAGSPTAEEMSAGVPPSASGYVLGTLTSEAPNLAQATATWAHGARLTVDQVAALDRLIAERLDESDHLGGHALPDSVTRGLAERAIGSLPPATVERARAAWRSLEGTQPELAEAFDALDLATDPRFIELLARSWRGSWPG